MKNQRSFISYDEGYDSMFFVLRSTPWRWFCPISMGGADRLSTKRALYAAKAKYGWIIFFCGLLCFVLPNESQPCQEYAPLLQITIQILQII